MGISPWDCDGNIAPTLVSPAAKRGARVVLHSEHRSSLPRLPAGGANTPLAVTSLSSPARRQLSAGHLCATHPGLGEHASCCFPKPSNGWARAITATATRLMNFVEVWEVAEGPQKEAEEQAANGGGQRGGTRRRQNEEQAQLIEARAM